MTTLIYQDMLDNEAARANAPADERRPWVEAIERDTPKPTTAELHANWRRLLDAAYAARGIKR